MKNAMKVLVLVLCVAMMVSVFTACGDVSGEYTGKVFGKDATYDFSLFGNTVTVTTGEDSEELTYELNEDGNLITFTNANGKSFSCDFEQGDDYIKLGFKADTSNVLGNLLGGIVNDAVNSITTVTLTKK